MDNQKNSSTCFLHSIGFGILVCISDL